MAKTWYLWLPKSSPSWGNRRFARRLQLYLFALLLLLPLKLGIRGGRDGITVHRPTSNNNSWCCSAGLSFAPVFKTGENRLRPFAFILCAKFYLNCRDASLQIATLIRKSSWRSNVSHNLALGHPLGRLFSVDNSYILWITFVCILKPITLLKFFWWLVQFFVF